MLASCPASILNQNSADSGIQNPSPIQLNTILL